MKNLLLILCFSFLFSCSKTPTESHFSEAAYNMKIDLKWMTPDFAVPAYAHVTLIYGMVHAKDTFLWKPGLMATEGLRNIAENGGFQNMSIEIDSIIARHKALFKFFILPPAITGSAQTVLNVNSNYSFVSFASMIAPSPDWFMGIHDFNLLQDDHWITDTTLKIYVYDAGTKQGNAFDYNFPATVPRESIILIGPASVFANNNPAVTNIGTLRLTRL